MKVSMRTEKNVAFQDCLFSSVLLADILERLQEGVQVRYLISDDYFSAVECAFKELALFALLSQYVNDITTYIRFWYSVLVFLPLTVLTRLQSDITKVVQHGNTFKIKTMKHC